MTTFPFEMMPESLMTQRLKLRAPVVADAQRIAMFVGDWDVVKMLARVPHPYREVDAVDWIKSLNRVNGAHYVLVHANGVIGVVGIEQNGGGVAQLGYWLAKPFWRRGLMTEAARAVVHAYRACDADAPLACCHFDDNAASQDVIEKLGFVATGVSLGTSLSRHEAVRSITYRLPVAASVLPPPVLTPA